MFISKVRISILRLFFTHRDVPYHVRGVVREIREEINAVRRELLRMAAIKLLRSENKGNRVYYTLNMDHTFFDELLNMVYKSFDYYLFVRPGDICPLVIYPPNYLFNSSTNSTKRALDQA